MSARPVVEKPEKILITGTGRCGTTFLLRLLTLLGLETGYTPETMEKFTYGNCNAGMERPISHKVLIVKNPTLITTLPAQLNSFRLHVILPLRNFDEAAKSRERIGVKKPGGLWDATNAEEQVEKYEGWVCKALVDIVQHDIPHTFLDFNRMIVSPKYLYRALEWLMVRFEVPYDRFVVAWEKASEKSRPK